MNELVEVLQSLRSVAVTSMVNRVIYLVPRYATLDRQVFLQRLERIYDAFVELCRTDDAAKFTSMLAGMTTERIDQGFTAIEVVRSFLVNYHNLRQLFSQSGLDENDAKRLYEVAESNLVRCTGIAINLYVGGLRRNSVQELEAVTRGAAAHEEFGERIVNSLSSGIAVIDRTTRIVKVWSPRMAEITELPADAVLGKPVEGVLAKVKGLPLAEAEEALRQSARVPVTRATLTLPSQRIRHVLLRAERLEKSADGHGGVVVVVDDTTERELLIESFSEYASQEVVERILSSQAKTTLSSERKTCSVLFADIRGFTSLSERLSPEALHELLNVYFQVMIDEVSSRGGRVDKFIGDKIMAVFTGIDHGAREACQAALGIQRAMAKLNKQRQASGAELIGIGIGVNTGEVMMGPVGSLRRMNFTVVGDAVNVADRLQSLAKAGEVIIGENTQALVDSFCPSQPLGAQGLKGRKAPCRRTD